MSWPDRIESYETLTGFPKSLFIAADGRVVGTWILGNDYTKANEYHGGYPKSYLKRVRALFPDMTRPLHVFSGRVALDIFPGDTVDLNPDLNPTYVDDAQTMTNVPLENHDIILVDPPYTGEDAEHYGTTMVKRKRVMDSLHRVCRGAYIVWLDQAWPMYRKDVFALEAVVGVLISTNHRIRAMTIYRRLATNRRL